eukprot:5123299-Alexandrium_andersonii.AAC.1
MKDWIGPADLRRALARGGALAFRLPDLRRLGLLLLEASAVLDVRLLERAPSGPAGGCACPRAPGPRGSRSG